MTSKAPSSRRSPRRSAEHILRKKLEAIQNELGEGPDSDKDELAQKLEP